jgi:ABC-type transport system substrate-binding protein
VDREKRKAHVKAFEKYVNGPPLAPEIEYTFYDNSEKAMFGFLAGEADFMCGLSRGQEKAIGKLPGIRVVKYASLYIYMLAFNTIKPPMDDILARKAISLLIDRQDLVSRSEYWRGGAIPTQYQFAMSPPVTTPQAGSPAPAEAFKLLKKAGYARTTKGWEKDGKPLRISMGLLSITSPYVAEARIIKRWLEEAGFYIDFETSTDSNDYDKYHVSFIQTYDKVDFENNSFEYEPGNSWNIFKSTDPAPAILLAGAKSSSITISAKEAVIRKIADYYYSVPLFYSIEYCVGRGSAKYDDVFFRSPMLFSAINRLIPPGPLRDQAGHGTNGR